MILPLLRPAIVAALVYSFVRAITAVSAVIFLVSAQYNLATAYIVGRVEISDFGVAIAYSSVLIVFMMLVIGLIQLGVGQRRSGAASRRPCPEPPKATHDDPGELGEVSRPARVTKRYGAVDGRRRRCPS